ncbi:MAG: rod shape-determining protein MreC, partial [Alphaproteobacteria bacterium]
MFLLAASGALIIMSQAKFSAADRIRTQVVDAFAPILETLSQPVDSISGLIGSARELVAVQEENARLRARIADLRRSGGEAARLAAENQSLRTLLKAIPKINGKHVTARVIGDAGGIFVHSLLLNAGLNDGVRKGLAVVNAEGLVGRVTGAGGRSARVLLVIDLNSRIPVVVQSTRDRAILAGD